MSHNSWYNTFKAQLHIKVWDLGRTNSPTSARHRDSLEFIKIWATPPKKLIFYDDAPSPYKWYQNHAPNLLSWIYKDWALEGGNHAPGASLSNAVKRSETCYHPTQWRQRSGEERPQLRDKTCSILRAQKRRNKVSIEPVELPRLAAEPCFT